MAGKFVLKKGTTGKFRFNLLARNGQVVATSEAYNSKAAAMGGIRSVKRLAADAGIEDQTTGEKPGNEAVPKASPAARKLSLKSEAKPSKKPSRRKTT